MTQSEKRFVSRRAFISGIGGLAAALGVSTYLGFSQARPLAEQEPSPSRMAEELSRLKSELARLERQYAQAARALTAPSSIVGSFEAEPILTLTPKAELKTVEGRWTFAPEVPPPIDRAEQRRVVVKWRTLETAGEIADGVTTDIWTFEGRVPGPLLRVRQGDLLELHLTNELGSKNPHSVDFHFATGPGGGSVITQVLPGETAVVELRALHPGLYIYHCATPDIPTHIAHGMYGLVLVEPARGLPRVDREYYIVQSEFYTESRERGKQRYSLSKGDLEEPTFVVFNGREGSLKDETALKARVGETVRFYVGNAGPNLVSSFHIIGEIFEKVYLQGSFTSPPLKDVQTTLIPAGGAAAVEVTFQVPGNYILVDHSIFRLHKGAIGFLKVDGPPNPEIYFQVSKGK